MSVVHGNNFLVQRYPVRLSYDAFTQLPRHDCRHQSTTHSRRHCLQCSCSRHWTHNARMKHRRQQWRHQADRQKVLVSPVKTLLIFLSPLSFKLIRYEGKCAQIEVTRLIHCSLFFNSHCAAATRGKVFL